MKFLIFSPAPMEGRVVSVPEGELISDEPLVVVQPKQYSKTQKQLMVVPFEVHAESGVIIDRGAVMVSPKTGQLCVEHYVDEIISPVDKKKEEKKEKAK